MVDPTEEKPTFEEVGPRVVLPEPEDYAELAQEFEPPPRFSLVRSVFFASLFGFVGAAIWAAVTLVTDYQIGLIAVAIGVLAGLGAAMGGRGRPAQIVGAVISAAAYFVGQTIIVIAFAVGSAPEATNEITPNPTEIVAADAVAPTEHAPAEQAPAPASDLAPGADVAAVQDGTDETEGGLIMMILALILMIVQATFSDFMNVLFLGIAVWEGWRIPRVQDD